MDHAIWHAHPLHLSDTAIRKWRKREQLEHDEVMDAIEDALTPMEEIWRDLGEGDDNDPGNSVLCDHLADPHALDPADVCEATAVRAWVMTCLDCLVGDERTVVLRIADGEKLPVISADVPDAANVKRRAVRKLRTALTPWWTDEWSQVPWSLDLDVMTVPRKTERKLYEIWLPVHVSQVTRLKPRRKPVRRWTCVSNGQGWRYMPSVKPSNLTGEPLGPWSPPTLTRNRLHYVTDKYDPLPSTLVWLYRVLPPGEQYAVPVGLKTRPKVMVKSGDGNSISK